MCGLSETRHVGVVEHATRSTSIVVSVEDTHHHTGESFQIYLERRWMDLCIIYACCYLVTCTVAKLSKEILL